MSEHRDVHRITAGGLVDDTLQWLHARGYRAHALSDRPPLVLFDRMNEPVRMAILGDVLTYIPTGAGEVTVE